MACGLCLWSVFVLVPWDKERGDPAYRDRRSISTRWSVMTLKRFVAAGGTARDMRCLGI